MSKSKVVPVAWRFRFMVENEENFMMEKWNFTEDPCDPRWLKDGQGRSGEIRPLFDIYEAAPEVSQEPVGKIVCHAEGDRCHGCAHYHGKAPVCEYAAPQPSGDAGDLVESYQYLRAAAIGFKDESLRLEATLKQRDAEINGYIHDLELLSIEKGQLKELLVQRDAVIKQLEGMLK